MATDSNLHEPSSGVRTYRGRTLGELLPQIRAELGPDAVILREREGLVGGIGGFFAQRYIEVDARRGEGRTVVIDAYERGDAQPPAAPGERPTPAGRRFETAAFIDRLREASAALRDDDAVDVRANRPLSVRPPSGRPPEAWAPPPSAPPPWEPRPWPEPAEPAFEPRAASGQEPPTKLESKTKRKGKGKGKAKDKARQKAKDPSKARAKAEADAEAKRTAQASSEWAAHTAAAAQARSAWAAESEAAARVASSQAADERSDEPLRRYLPDVLAAFLLLIVLGPRRFRSGQRGSWQAPCPVCGRRGATAAPGHYGRPGGSRPRWLLSRQRHGGCPCQYR